MPSILPPQAVRYISEGFSPYVTSLSKMVSLHTLEVQGGDICKGIYVCNTYLVVSYRMKPNPLRQTELPIDEPAFCP